MNNDHYVELEQKIAEQEHTSSQLSHEIYLQQKRITELEKHMQLLTASIKQLKDESIQGETPIDRPPHY